MIVLVGSVLRLLAEYGTLVSLRLIFYVLQGRKNSGLV